MGAEGTQTGMTAKKQSHAMLVTEIIAAIILGWIVLIYFSLPLFRKLGLYSNYYFNKQLTDLSSATKYGEEHSRSDCTSTALDKMKLCREEMCELRISKWAKPCLQIAKDNGYCATVPPQNQAQDWKDKACADKKFTSAAKCKKVMDPIVEFCDEKNSKNHSL